MPLQAKKASSSSSSAWKDNPHHTRTSDTAAWSMPETASVSRRHTPRTSSRSRHAPLAKKKRPRPRKIAVSDSSSDNGSAISPPGSDLKGGSGDDVKNTGGGDGDDNSWYAIKDIIDERVEKRRRFYLVDWADHPETGVSYPPSWIPARDASSDAVKAWKTSRLPARTTPSIATPGTTTPSRATPSRATPSRATPSRATPSRATPSRATPSRATPSRATSSIATPNKATLSSSYDFVHESVEDLNTPEPKPVSRKRAASPSESEDSPVTKKQKGLREVPQLPPVPLSSDPFSRDASTESPELDPVPAAQPTKALAIELNPGSDFDPDDYLRYSQLQSQSQSQSQSQPRPQLQSQLQQQPQAPSETSEPQPQSHSQFQPWSPADGAEPLAPSGLQPSPRTQHHFSPQTIPDSEADIATNASTLGFRSGAATLPSAGASVPSAPRNSPSHQPESNGDLGAVVPPSNNKDELRETADWKSEHSSGPRVFQVTTPWDPTQAPEGSRAESRNGSGNESESSLFLTQPEADFDLLSDLQSQQPVAAGTPASPNQRNRSPSIIPDSTRRDQLDRDLHSAQVVQLLHSRRHTLFSAEQSPDSRALFTHDEEEVVDEDRHENTEGQREGDNSIQHTLRFTSRLLEHELELVIPRTTPPKPPTPSQINDESDIGSMDGDNAPLDPVALLRKAHLDALGPDGLTMTELPSDTIKRYLAQDSSQSSPPVGDAVHPSTTSALSPVLPLFGEQAALEGPPATIDTSLLVGSETAMPGVPLEMGASVGATIAPMALSLAAPVLSISPEPAEEEQHSVLDEAVQGSPSPASLTDMTDRADSPASTEIDRHRESLSPSAFAPYTREYTVTLPLAANSRQRYIDLIMDKENQKTIKEFGEVFARGTYELPSTESSDRVDSLLQKLLDLSDLPPFSDSLPALTTEARMKYAANTNGKYTFLHELLGPVRAMDRKVLILARKGVLLDYIEALVTQLGLPLLRIDKASGSKKDGATDSCRQLSVVLSDTEASPMSLPQDVDFVIGFDHTARTSGLLANYLGNTTSDSASRTSRLPQPVVLLLVASYTLEHIDLRLPLINAGDQERKNALLLCTLECLPYLQDSAYDDQPVKPHESAAAFAKAFANPRADIGWKSVSLPDDVFDIYISSSGSTHPVMSQEESVSLANFGGGSLSRKHQLDDDIDEEDGEEAQKRARPNGFAAPIVPNKNVALSDTLKSALHGSLTTSGQTVTISLSQLEALAARTVALESQLREKEIQEAMLLERVRTLDRLAKDTTATIVTCERKLLQAVKDRGVFETERDKAAKDAETAKERLASHESAIADLKTSNATLSEKLAEMTVLLAGSAVPDVVRLATAEAEAEAAKRKAAALERKVANAETDLAHARRAYQDASNAAADLSSENRDLSTRTKELSRLAAENLRQIHETNQRCEADEYRRQWTEMQVVMRERDRELEWAREELRVLKNGRRETRAQSVPRSPRLGVMSPRTVVGRTTAAVASAAGGGAGSGGGSSSSGGYNNNNNNNNNNNGHSSSVSRGNSPIAGNFDGGGGGSGGLVGGPGGGAASLAPVPGLTYLNQQQGGGRWGHLRD